MPGRNGQRKPGTTRGSPRRSRTAKASRISRHAAKSGRAREWGGWGRLSDDGPGQNNPDPSEDPWGGGLPNLHGGASTRNRPDTARDNRACQAMHERWMQTEREAAYAGSRLKPTSASGRPHLTGQPSSRTDRLGELASWDRGQLALELEALKSLELDFSLAATGFELNEVDLRIEAVDAVHSPSTDGRPCGRPMDRVGRDQRSRLRDRVGRDQRSRQHKGPPVAQAGDAWMLWTPSPRLRGRRQRRGLFWDRRRDPRMAGVNRRKGAPPSGRRDVRQTPPKERGRYGRGRMSGQDLLAPDPSPTGKGAEERVGRRHPPVVFRFRPGQSGNPRGRPKRNRVGALVEKALGEKVEVTENGRRRSITKLEAAVTQLANSAAKGDQRATQLVLALLPEDHGRPPPRPPERRSEGDKLVVAELVRRIRGSAPRAMREPPPPPHRASVTTPVFRWAMGRSPRFAGEDLAGRSILRCAKRGGGGPRQRVGAKRRPMAGSALWRGQGAANPKRSPWP